MRSSICERNWKRTQKFSQKIRCVLGRFRRGRECMIKIDLREVGSEDADWVRLVENMKIWRILAYAAMNPRVL
jgi:hypothetical protein